MDLTNYRTLGKSGLRVSPLTLGTMTFGEEWGWGSTVQESKEILKAYLDQGGNIVDTANLYTKGHSEKIIGDYLHENQVRRDGVVLSTKFYGNLYPGDPNAGGTSRKTIINSLENSLRRLQTDYIDLYWMHAFDEFTPIEETMSALNDLVVSGKVRYIAVSDTPAWKVAQAQTIAQFRGWSPFISLQSEYSLLERTPEGELIPMAQELGLGVMPWSPLKGGILTGKYTKESNGASLSGRLGNPDLPESTYVIIERLKILSEQKGTTVSAIALAWVMAMPVVTSTLIGARTIDQLNQNLASLSVALSDEEVGYLNEVSEPVLNFPIPFMRAGYHNGMGGTTINGKTSLISSILPKNSKEVY
ncbi:aldo/keto reductase [Pedobacter metabolipauper]|uniref:Aryl-alcohol dehydrogenase-like predicted oxidoreductase n=1 Tax=Pedobacter metabolipauper TaxID=425513 RepID=A0A4R6SUM6_9SPHI|nr:aldo/keto reductase [Pedobacter metabolipauper]TDQ08430.1 aryl-alcohol dehydrogenase-like predicted oxidoreductase [Pedobacter metabolipauper]